MAEQSARDRVVLAFGRFALVPGERLLTADGAPLELGERTLDTLIALASHPNEVIGKRELMARVWPDVTVEEGSLRFHIAALRKALGDGKDGARFITTFAGRGYCFVAPVTRSDGPIADAPAADAQSSATSFLPERLARLVGRDDDIRALSAELAASRFVTIVGAGGIGKTTVAIAVAHDLLRGFDGAALFVDFSILSDPSMVPAAVASLLGMSIQSDDPMPGLVAFFRERRMLLVLDNCEHVVEDAARLAARLFAAAPKVHILATSREALRAEGERVHRLMPLRVPPDDPALGVEATLAFPAARLFVERAAASGARLELAEADAAIVARICRKLDGMALAIELAAGRVEAYGLGQTAALLDQRFTLLWPGQRTAPARQKTLQATLDWSYGLLSGTERAVFRRLAVFAGPFSLEGAVEVVADETIGAAQVLAAVDSLVLKSMVTAFSAGAAMRYRLLDTARAYAMEIDADGGGALASRHAAWCLHWLERSAAGGQPLSNAAERASLLGELNNVRAALEWCFGDDGNADLGVSLAAAAAPVLFAVSLLTDCQRWSRRAIGALDAAMLGGRREMRLQAALALSSMWIRGDGEAAFAAMNRSIAIARQLDDSLNQITLLAPLHVFHLITAQFRDAMQCAERVAELARQIADPQADKLARILLGYSFHFAGDLAGARHELEAALRQSPGNARSRSQKVPSPATMSDDAMGAPILALASAAAPSALARTLWLQGDSAAALAYVNQTIADATSTDHPVTLLVALMYAVSVLIWNGDFDEAERQTVRFISIAESHEMTLYVELGRCFEGQLAISRGDAGRGIELLRTGLHDLHAHRYGLMTSLFDISLVLGFAAIGRCEEGLSHADAAIRSVEANGDLCFMPELLRAKAHCLRRLAQPQEASAEACLTESLALSRRQGALAWELRTSIDLARHLAAQGRTDRARELLRPVVDAFAAGAATADLRTAGSLLSAWG